MEKVVLIFGPTGVQKSETAIELAKGIGEIISADSMQIYKKMDIGTAKVDKEQRELVSHHLIDIIEPDSYFTVQHFNEKARKLIHNIIKHSKIPFVVGGTGLYFKALINGLFEGPSKDYNLRGRLEGIYEEKGADFLYQKLKEVDFKSAIKIHLNDKKRLIRALEVFELTKKPISQFWEDQSKIESYNFLKIGLTLERDELYHRINERCGKMLNKGLVDEVRTLKEAGYTCNLQSMQGIGYKHFYNYLNGELDLTETVRQFKRDTRRFAKRQWTLFLRFQDTYWFTPREITEIRNLIFRFLKED